MKQSPIVELVSKHVMRTPKWAQLLVPVAAVGGAGYLGYRWVSENAPALTPSLGASRPAVTKMAATPASPGRPSGRARKSTKVSAGPRATPAHHAPDRAWVLVGEKSPYFYVTRYRIEGGKATTQLQGQDERSGVPWNTAEAKMDLGQAAAFVARNTGDPREELTLVFPSWTLGPRMKGVRNLRWIIPLGYKLLPKKFGRVWYRDTELAQTLASLVRGYSPGMRVVMGGAFQSWAGGLAGAQVPDQA